jgi:hypothetical protein
LRHHASDRRALAARVAVLITTSPLAAPVGHTRPARRHPFSIEAQTRDGIGALRSPAVGFSDRDDRWSRPAAWRRVGDCGEPMADTGRRPELRVNQLGYLPTAPKCAVWRSDTLRPEAFWVRDRSGREVFGGWTVRWPQRPEPSSGLAVHVLDFSAMEREGVGFVVEVAGARSHAFAVAVDLYRPLVRDALAFFYLQRSGCAIDEERPPSASRWGLSRRSRLRRTARSDGRSTRRTSATSSAA